MRAAYRPARLRRRARLAGDRLSAKVVPPHLRGRGTVESRGSRELLLRRRRAVVEHRLVQQLEHHRRHRSVGGALGEPEPPARRRRCCPRRPAGSRRRRARPRRRPPSPAPPRRRRAPPDRDVRAPAGSRRRSPCTGAPRELHALTVIGVEVAQHECSGVAVDHRRRGGLAAAAVDANRYRPPFSTGTASSTDVDPGGVEASARPRGVGRSATHGRAEHSAATGRCAPTPGAAAPGPAGRRCPRRGRSAATDRPLRIDSSTAGRTGVERVIGWP